VKDGWDKGPQTSLWIISNGVLEQWKLWCGAFSLVCLPIVHASQIDPDGSIVGSLVIISYYDIKAYFLGGYDLGVDVKVYLNPSSLGLQVD
jgi:hypothetical protein